MTLIKLNDKRTLQRIERLKEHYGIHNNTEIVRMALATMEQGVEA